MCVPWGKMAINQIRRQNLVRTKVKMGSNAALHADCKTNTSAVMLFLTGLSENPITLAVISLLCHVFFVCYHFFLTCQRHKCMRMESKNFKMF